MLEVNHILQIFYWKDKWKNLLSHRKELACKFANYNFQEPKFAEWISGIFRVVEFESKARFSISTLGDPVYLHIFLKNELTKS